MAEIKIKEGSFIIEVWQGNQIKFSAAVPGVSFAGPHKVTFWHLNKGAAQVGVHYGTPSREKNVDVPQAWP